MRNVCYRVCLVQAMPSGEAPSGVDRRQTQAALLNSLMESAHPKSDSQAEENRPLLGTVEGMEPAVAADGDNMDDAIASVYESVCVSDAEDGLGHSWSLSRASTANGPRQAAFSHSGATSLAHGLDSMLAASQRRSVAAIAFRLSPELRFRKAIAEIEWCAKTWRRNARRMVQTEFMYSGHGQGENRYHRPDTQLVGVNATCNRQQHGV
jgi:hypothetical protein